jgi:hypothetical protein
VESPAEPAVADVPLVALSPAGGPLLEPLACEQAQKESATKPTARKRTGRHCFMDLRSLLDSRMPMQPGAGIDHKFFALTAKWSFTEQRRLFLIE